MKQTILSCAKTEFIKKGYKDASMRAIAKQAGTVVGNIYNYFGSKDALFCHVLQPLIDELDRVMVEHNEDQNISLDIFSNASYHQQSINAIFGLTEKFADELKLLWFGAEGSSLEDYKKRLVDRQTRMGKNYLTLMQEKYPQININISHFFLHLTSCCWITLIGELIRNEHCTPEEKQQAIGEYITHGMAGWKSLMQI